MGNPIHYRDERCTRGMELLLEKYDEETLKENTGMDLVSYNTINQFMVDRYIRWDQAAAILNTPDLFNYFFNRKKNYQSIVWQRPHSFWTTRRWIGTKNLWRI